MYYIQDYEYYVILINIIALLCLTENGRQMRNLGFFLSEIKTIFEMIPVWGYD